MSEKDLYVNAIPRLNVFYVRSEPVMYFFNTSPLFEKLSENKVFHGAVSTICILCIVHIYSFKTLSQ
jgi:hypothetical protein